MTWDAYHRRKKTLSDMLAIADQRRDVTIAELLDTVPDARSAFADETEVLFELQMTWFQRLSGHVDRLLADGAETPELVAVTAWVDTAADLPGARALLDVHRDEPQPGFDVNECLEDIEAHGFHLTDAHVRITDQAV